MRIDLISRRSIRLAFAAAFAAGALAFTVGSSAAHTVPQSGVVIQIRDFPSSSVVEVLAWNALEPAIGLRTFVRRSGAPDRYHRLWVNSEYPGGNGITDAKGLNRPLQFSTATDAQNCLNGKCAPSSTFGARIPDGPFRASKDPLEVKFVTNSGSELTITARRPLIDAYLAAVDSVATSLKK